MKTKISISFVKSTSLLLAISGGLSGCAGSMLVPTSFPFVAGNWQIDSTDPKAAGLAAFSGSLTGDSTNVHALLHVNNMNSCVKPTDIIEMSGWANRGAVLTLTGNVAGGLLTVQGVLAEDGRSLGETWYEVEGGPCSVPPSLAAARNYKPVSGTYAGSFKDSNGLVSSLSANLLQSPEPDINGNYTLSGAGTFKAFPCLSGPSVVSNTMVTGENLAMTYLNSTTGDSVTVAARFTADGQSVTVMNWTLIGACGADTGTGSLVQQTAA
jgi:hypothetical protein